MILPALKRGYLIAMMIVIGLACTICGVIMIFAGSHGRFMDATLLIALALGYLLVVSLLCFVPLEKRRWRPIAWTGLTLSALGVIFSPPYICLQEGFYPPLISISRELEEMVGSYFFIVGYLALVSLILTPRMNLVGRILQGVTVACISGFLLFMLGMVWEFWRPYGREMDQIMFALMIFSSGGALGVYVLNKFFAIKPVEQLREVTHTLTVCCPRCLSTQELPVGESNCRHCKLHFKIEVEEPRCRNCQYILRGLTRPICPECGTVFREEELVQAAADGLPPIPNG